MDQATLEVAKGVILVQTGKSTLIKMLTTLLPRPPVAQPLLVTTSCANQAWSDSSLTAAENMLVSAWLYGIPAHERNQRIDGALAAMGLSELPVTWSPVIRAA